MHLEHLILSWPDSALLPQARHELDLARASGGDSPPVGTCAMHSERITRREALRRGSAMIAALGPIGSVGTWSAADRLLVPMDDAQRQHLKAYGLTYHALTDGMSGEWLLNYRGGAFLLPDAPSVRRQAALAGVVLEEMDASDVAGDAHARSPRATWTRCRSRRRRRSRSTRRRPSPPWDDAVTLAMEHAGIEYAKLYDDEVLRGDLVKYDWVHLHHEDFTGQLHKLHLSYRDAPWFIAQRDMLMATATKLGFTSVPALKKAVASRIRDYVENGGFLFAMCGATETLELANAAANVDIAGPYADGTPIDPDASSQAGLVAGLRVPGSAGRDSDAAVSAMSDIDGHQVNVPSRKQPLGAFTLFDFAAKFDPVPAMLVQNHRNVIPDYYGVTTSFLKRVLKPGVTILASEDGAPWVKYIHGHYGKGTWTYPRRARSRGSAAQHREPAHRTRAASDVARLPADPQQRPVPGGEEEAAQDVKAGRDGARTAHCERRANGARETARSRRRAHAACHRGLRGDARGDHGSPAGARSASSARSTPAAWCRPRASSRAAIRGRCSRCRGSRARGELLIHNHPSGVLEPSDADLGVAARLHDDGIGFAIVDNAVVAHLRGRRGAACAHADAARTARRSMRLLGPDGPIAARAWRIRGPPRASARWRRRSRVSTRWAASACSRPAPASASRWRTSCPALRWAALNDERTIVATATIPLQEQLFAKDLPFLERALERPEGALRAAQGMAQLPVPAAAAAGARECVVAVRRRTAHPELASIVAWAERTAGWHARRPPDRAAPGRVGRGRRRGRPVHAPALSALHGLLRVQGPAPRRRSRRGDREPPPADGRRRGASRPAELE